MVESQPAMYCIVIKDNRPRDQRPRAFGVRATGLWRKVNGSMIHGQVELGELPRDNRRPGMTISLQQGEERVHVQQARHALLERELGRWLPLLIAHEQPDKIILFGSY